MCFDLIIIYYASCALERGADNGEAPLAVLKIEGGAEARKNKRVEAYEAVSASVEPGRIILL